MKFRRITSLFTAAVVAVSAMFSALPATVAYAADNEWTDNGDGSWSYQNGNSDITDYIEGLSLDLSSVEDWSAIEYISVDVEVTGHTCLNLGGDFTGAEDGSGWQSASNKDLENDSVTMYLNTDGQQVYNCVLNFCGFDDNNTQITADTLVTVSNITFSTEERDYSDCYNEWYTQNDNWYYRNGDSDITDYIEALNFDLSSVEDWSAVKYFSVDVEVAGQVALNIGGDFTGAEDGSGWSYTNGKTIQDETVTLYFNTDGQQLYNMNMGFCGYDDNNTQIAANTLVTVSNITFSTEERDYSDVYNEWYKVDDTWYYVNGDEYAEGNLNGLEIIIPDDINWTDIKYISADVTITGAVGGALFNASKGMDEEYEWKDGNRIDTQESGEFESHIFFDNEEWESVHFNLWRMNANSSIAVSNIVISTEQYDYSQLIGEWYEDEGTWYYRNGDSAVDGIPSLQLDTTDVDWSTVKYISADVTAANGTVAPVIIFVTDENGTLDENVQAKSFTGSKNIYRNTNGNSYYGAQLHFWWYEDNVSVGANEVISVNNITFSTEKRDFSNVYNEWYEDEGIWYYRNGDSDVTEIPALDINTSSVEDWSAIQYIGATITTEGKAQAAIGGNVDTDGNWQSGNGVTVTNGSANVIFETNGHEVLWPVLMLWSYDANDTVLAANTLVAVSDIVFSTEKYSDGIEGEPNTWFQTDDGAWHYINGETALTDPLRFEIDTSSVEDWSNIAYVEVEVEVRGTAFPVLGANVGVRESEEDNLWTDGEPAWTETGRSVITLDTNGEPVDGLIVNFWNVNSDEGIVIEAGTRVSILSVEFVAAQDQPSASGEGWTDNGDGSYTYVQGEDVTAVSNLEIDMSGIDATKIKYIRADITASTTVFPVFGGSDTDGTWYNGDPVWMQDGGSASIYMFPEGAAIDYLTVNFWNIYGDVIAEQGTEITVSNITYSEEEPTGAWFPDGDGFSYINGDEAVTQISSFNINTSSVEDWSTIVYISADVSSESPINPCMGANLETDSNWVNGEAKNFVGGEATVYYFTEGKDVFTPQVQFWGTNDEGTVLEAGQRVTISNIVFSTEDVPEITGETNEWFEGEDGKWYYINGEAALTESPDFVIDISSVEDWSQISAIKAKIEIVGSASVVIAAQFEENGDFTNGDYSWMSGNRNTLTVETDGQDVYDARVQFWNINDTDILAPGTIIIVSDIEFVPAEDENPIGEWYEVDGTWYYRNGDSDVTEIPSLEINTDSVEDWSAVKYVGVTVSCEGRLQPVIGGNLGSDDNWQFGNSVTFENDTIEVIMTTNGSELLYSSLSFWSYDENGTVLAANAVIEVSNIVFSTEEYDYSKIIGSWYELDGTWYYRNGDSNVESIPGLRLDISSVEDWSAIKYISADVTASGTVSPVILIAPNEDNNLEEDGFATIFKDGTMTIYRNTDGITCYGAELQFWWYDTEVAVDANAVISVSNITFSTEERDYSDCYNQWYEIDGTWYYRNGDSTATQVQALGIDISSIEDWSEITYIKATVTTDAMINAVIGANYGASDNWQNGTCVSIADGTKDIIFVTDGTTILDPIVMLWSISDDGTVLDANALVTVSDIEFCTGPVPTPVDEWYEDEDGVWHYVDSGDGIVNEEFPCLAISVGEDDITDVTYVTADVSVNGEIVVGLTVAAEGELYKDGTYKYITGEDTVRIFAYEDIWEWFDLNIVEMSEGAEITVSNLTHSTEDITDYTGIIGEWIQTGENSYYYNHGELAEGGLYDYHFMPSNYDMSEVQTISMTVNYTGETEDAVRVAVSGTDKNDEWFPGYNFTVTDKAQTVTRNYRGSIISNPSLDVVSVFPGMEIIISDITFGTEAVADIEVGEDEILIDDNKTVFSNTAWGPQHDVNYLSLSKITETGRLLVYVDPVANDSDLHQIIGAWNSWGEDAPGFTWIGEPDTVTEDGYIYEIAVDEAALALFTDYAYECELCLRGVGVEITKIIFTTAEAIVAPENAEITATAGNFSVELKWNAVENAESYKVYTYIDGKFTEVAEAIDVTYTVTELTAYKEYGFLVSVCVDGVWSEPDAADVVYATPVAPTKPDKVTATAGIGEITVTWAEVYGATKYRVRRHDGTKWVNHADVTETSYVDTEVTAGTTYKYAIYAYVNGAWGDASAVVSATPEASTVAENVKAVSANGEITVTWDAVNGATKYRVRRHNGTKWVNHADVTETSYIDTDVIEGTTYQYAIYAYVNGAWGDASAIVSATAEGSAVAENVKATAGNGEITVTWDAVSGATKYRVRRHNGTKWVNHADITETSYVDTDVITGTTYKYAIYAYVNGSWGSASAIVSATAQGSTVAENVKATAGNGEITLTWDAVSAATKYRVRRHDGTKWTNYADITENTFVDTDVINGTTYKYAIYAYVNGAWGNASAIVSAAATGSTVAENLVATAGNGVVDLTWDAVAGATKYRIRRHDGTKWANYADVSETFFEDTDVTNGITYKYAIYTYVNGAWGDASVIVSATPTGSTVAENVEATAGNGEVNLTWDTVTGATKYRVRRHDGTKWSNYADVTENFFDDTDVTNGITYKYAIYSYINGAWGDASIIVTATPTGSTIAENVEAIAADGKVTVTWDTVAGATKYRVRRHNGVKWTNYADVTENSFVDTEVTEGITYKYAIYTYMNGAWGDPSIIVTATP